MLRRTRSRFCRSALLLFSLAAASAAPISAKHAKVELAANKSEVAAGGVALLGLHFILEPGWHIYWKNPGDSGQPPTLEWQLPQGFTAGDIEWPVPERLQASPELADYGYKDDVLLLVPLKVGPAATSDSAAQLTLNAKWLICREVCLPDHAEMKLSLPVGSATRNSSAQTNLFASARQHLPKPLPRGWKTSATEKKDSFVLKITAPEPLRQAQFFPATAGQIDNAARQVVRGAPRGLSLELKKSDLLLKPIAVLQGVLVLSDHRAFALQAPVRTPGR